MGINLYFDSKIEGLNLDQLKYKYNMDFVSNSIPVHKSGLIEIKRKLVMVNRDKAEQIFYCISNIHAEVVTFEAV